MSPRHLAPLFALLLGAACTQFPELDATISPETANSDYPPLVPFDQLLASAAPTPGTAEAAPRPEDSVIARSAALQARAARLRGEVVDAATRRRMARGVPQG